LGSQQFAAAQLNKVNSSNGDLFVPNNAYYAMVDTVAGTLGDQSRSYKKDFNKLCSSSVDASISAGCAMLAFNFDAANSRDISNYYYQVTNHVAT
jgi:glycerol dehydrogenase-like iron-containing ADH family enzyme